MSPSFRVPRDAHLRGTFNAYLQYRLALLQREAPDGLDVLELGQAGGLWERRGSFRPSHSWDQAMQMGQYGVGMGPKKELRTGVSHGDEEGINDD